MGVSVPDNSANVTLTRNPIGRILSVTQGGTQRTYDYTTGATFAPGNFLYRITEPETGTTIFGRDANGNMTSRTVSGSPATGFSYDAMDRLSLTTYPTGTPNVTRTYYFDGLLKTVESTNAIRLLDYDANKNLTLDRLTVAGRVYSLVNAYTGNDGLDSVTYPSGWQVTYAANGYGRPRQAAPFTNTANSIAFHPSGTLSSIAFANGLSTTVVLSNRLWPAGMTTTNGVANFQYTYDGLGNVLSYTDTVTGQSAA